MKRESYNQTVKDKYEKKTELIVSDLPLFIQLYFDANFEKMSYKTLLGYAYDIQKFLNWLKNDSYEFYKRIGDITASDFSMVESHDIERYILFLQSDDTKHINSAVSIRRKISSLSSIYNFLCDHFYVDENPCKDVEYPDIVVPDNNVLLSTQVSSLLDIIAKLDNYSDKQKAYIDKTKERDFTIIALLLFTGIRINECVELDVNSINFNNKTLRVNRGADIFLPISDRMIEILEKYKKNRDKIESQDKALFLSMQNKRMCTQAIEDMIKKYGKQAKLPFALTPKIFRHSFAAELYNITANADLINSYLGKRKVTEIKILINHLSQDNKTLIYKSINDVYKDALVVFPENSEFQD